MKTKVDYWTFHKQWHALGCFNTHQVYAWRPDFNRLNFSYWEKKGLLVKLRNAHYAFADYLGVPDFARYIANRIYQPSYISLHTALAYYGMIPEAVAQITSVGTLKTARFHNRFADYVYQSVKPALMFGYESKPMADSRGIYFATPEKALLDLLYLYPFYQTASDMAALRLDEEYMQEELDRDRLDEYAGRIGGQALSRRVKVLYQTYGL